MVSCKSTVVKKNQTSNSLNSISWLKDMKTSFEKNNVKNKVMILQYMYHGELVFLVESCYQCPDGTSRLYNSKKEIICTFGGIIGAVSCSDFSEKATEEKLIWKNFE